MHTNPDDGPSAAYLALNPLGLIPTFRKPDGEVLTEVIAIAYYCECRTSAACAPCRSHDSEMPALTSVTFAT